MLQQQRHDIILSILAENGTVHTADLVKRMDVSSETIRKDLDYLEKAGQLTRVHGGAMPASDRDSRSEERRVGKECRSRWSPYH